MLCWYPSGNEVRLMIHPFCTGNDRRVSVRKCVKFQGTNCGLEHKAFTCGFLEFIIVGGIWEVNDLMMLENNFFFPDLRNKLELDGMIYVLVKIYCLWGVVESYIFHIRLLVFSIVVAFSNEWRIFIIYGSWWD